MTIRRHFAAAAIVVSVSSPLAVRAFAHEGHAHGGEEAEAGHNDRCSHPGDVLVRVRTCDGRPGRDAARVPGPLRHQRAGEWRQPWKASADGEAVTASPVEGEEGVYRLQAAWLSRSGPHELTFSITSDAAADLLIGTLEIPRAAPKWAGERRGVVERRIRRARPGPAGLRPMLGAVMVFLLGSLTTVALTQRVGRARSPGRPWSASPCCWPAGPPSPTAARTTATATRVRASPRRPPSRWR